MPSPIFYYGAPAKSNQVVSEEVRAKGLSLLMGTPSDQISLSTALGTTANYELYKAFFPQAFKAAV